MSGTSAAKKPFRPLCRRVVAWALLYGTIFTLFVTASLVCVDYQDDREEALRQLRFAATSYRKSLANSLWELDMAGVRLQLDGLHSFPMVGQAVLTTSVGQTIQVGSQSEQDPADALSWKETLFSPYDPQRVIGQLHLFVDREAFHQRLRANTLRIVVAEAIKGVVAALLVAWLIARLVTRHLSHMAAQMASPAGGALGRPLTLQRRESRYQDELDQLRDAFNERNRQLAEYFDTQRALEEELRKHRDRLSDMVGERTRSLERLRGFHGLVIRVLTRFINLPPGHANDAVDYGLGAFGDYFGAVRCLLMTYDAPAHGFHIENAWPALQSDGSDDIFLSDDVLPRRLLAERQSRIWLCPSTEHGVEDPLLALFSCTAYTAVGVEVKGTTVGLLCLVGRTVPQDGDAASLLELAARVAASMLDHKAAQLTLLDTQQALQKANRELHSMSRRDALTSLPNRRQFDEVKEVEFRRALRAAWPLSVLMCDLDEFKRYNDTYGHALGDQCLARFGSILTSLFGRAGELPVRLGGEEFAVLLPNTSGEQALALAERLRQSVWETNIPHSSSSAADRVTVSIGVACLKHGLHSDFDSLLQDADLALYRAKNGRNRAVLAE
ncbi:MAG TPA: diguanylate cyclase [Noviherbaspirillum sp.]|nr:diguanylate cyclase [Noviherbaspirillum sp.]